MTPNERFVAVVVGIGLVVFAAGWLFGHLTPWWRLVEWAHRDRLDDIYEEGYDDARRASRDTVAGPWLAGPPETRDEDDVRLPAAPGPAHPSDLALGLVEGRGRADQPIRVDSAVHISDWRADYAEQLAPAVLDAENLRGPDGALVTTASEWSGEVMPTAATDERLYPLEMARAAVGRAGEFHRRAVVDLGQTGDDKMLTRDWFARRAFIDGLWRDDVGGFEISDHGHLVAVAAA